MKPGSFLSVGECMVEVAPAREGLYRIGFAGDSFNTAWYARHLLPPGWTTDYATLVGRDAISGKMLAFMAAEGIGTDAIGRLSDRTVGLYMISLKDGERSFSYWRGQSAARCLGDDAAWLARVLSGRRIIHFTGITLAILPPEGRATLLAALARARVDGAFVSFDTNQRPKLWEGPEAMRQSISKAAEVADLVLPSYDEEKKLFGDTAPEETARRYREQGASRVVVKNGGTLGVIADSDGLRRFEPAPVTEVVDTTAAGDSFGAGVLAGLSQGRTLDEAVDAAVALAARVIAAPGALVREALPR